MHLHILESERHPQNLIADIIILLEDSLARVFCRKFAVLRQKWKWLHGSYRVQFPPIKNTVHLIMRLHNINEIIRARCCLCAMGRNNKAWKLIGRCEITIRFITGSGSVTFENYLMSNFFISWVTLDIVNCNMNCRFYSRTKYEYWILEHHQTFIFEYSSISLEYRFE